MRGPWSFASQEWGLVCEGYQPAPVILAPYNPPWYNDQLEAFGLQKAKDLLVYYIDAREGYQINERYLTLTELVKKKYHIRTRPVDMKNLERDVVTIVGSGQPIDFAITGGSIRSRKMKDVPWHMI